MKPQPVAPAVPGGPQPPSGIEAPSAIPSVEPSHSAAHARRPSATLALALLLLGAVFVFQILGAVVGYAFGINIEASIYASAVAGTIIALTVLGGASLLKPTRASVAYAFRHGWWVIFVSAGLMVFDLVSLFADGDFTPVSDWPLRVLGTFALCVCIGISEEGAFRGLMLGGLLDVKGTNKRGIVIACVVSATLFGLAHVDVAAMNLTDPLQLAQALLKAIQTGTYGFFLAALVVRTKDIVGAVILHALDDFFLMVPTVALMGESLDVDYVTSGADALPTITLYLVVIVLYLPLVWQGVRMLREVDAPNQGPFHRQ